MGANQEGKKQEPEEEEEDDYGDYGDEDADSLDYARDQKKPVPKASAAGGLKEPKPPDAKKKSVRDATATQKSQNMHEDGHKKASSPVPDEAEEDVEEEEKAKEKEEEEKKDEREEKEEKDEKDEDEDEEEEGKQEDNEGEEQEEKSRDKANAEEEDEEEEPKGDPEPEPVEEHKNVEDDRDNGKEESEPESVVAEDKYVEGDSPKGDEESKPDPPRRQKDHTASPQRPSSPKNDDPSSDQPEEAPPSERKREIVRAIQQFSKWRVQYETQRKLHRREIVPPPVLRRRMPRGSGSVGRRVAVQQVSALLETVATDEMKKENRHFALLEKRREMRRNYELKLAGQLISRAVEAFPRRPAVHETIDFPTRLEPEFEPKPRVQIQIRNRRPQAVDEQLRKRLEIRRALKGYLVGTDETSRNPYQFVQSVLKAQGQSHAERQEEELPGSPYAPMVLQSILNRRRCRNPQQDERKMNRLKLPSAQLAFGGHSAKQQKERSFSTVAEKPDRRGWGNESGSSLILPPIPAFKRSHRRKLV